MKDLKCMIELNKEEGILIKLKNPAGGIDQSIILDGVAITTTCTDGSDTSVITQKSDSIAIKCKTYTVDAETIEMTSEKETTHKSGTDMTLDSGMNLTNKAVSKIQLDSMDTDIKATNSLKAKSLTADITSDTMTKIKSPLVDIAGDADVKISGTALVEITGGIIKLQ